MGFSISDIGGAISDVVGDVAGAASAIPDPIAQGISTVGKALGLDPKLVGLAECAVGAMTGDVMCAVHGVNDIMNDRTGAAGGKPAQQPAGYAPPSQGQDTNAPAATTSTSATLASSSTGMDDHAALQTIRNHFPAIDTNGDGKLSPLEIDMASRNSELPQDVRDACAHLKANDALITQLHNESGTGHVALASQRTVTISALDEELTHTTSSSTTTGTSATPGTSSSGTAPSMDERTALTYIQQHFGEFDTAQNGGQADGLIGKGDLQAVANNPNASPEARAAAKYFLDNPPAFDQAETAQFHGKADGLLGKGDVDAMLSNMPAAQQGTVTASDAKATNTIDFGPNDTVESIIAKCMSSMLGQADADVKAAADKLKNDPKSEEAKAELQRAMNARTELMTLESNMQNAEHQAAMSIIGNIR